MSTLAGYTPNAGPQLGVLRALLQGFSWQAWRQHPWRQASAVLAVMLGVALAFSVHLINASALDEFASAMRTAGGQPDLELRAAQGSLDESLYARAALHPNVALASPVLELQTTAVAADGRRVTLRVLGVDALLVAGVAPALLPQPASDAPRMALFAPRTLFLNAAALRLLRGTGPNSAAADESADAAPPTSLALQVGMGLQTLRIGGTLPRASGPALAVMDLGAAQDLFARSGELSRIDLRLQPGTRQDALLAELALPAGVQALQPGQDTERASQLSRAYRVNLTVLALVALFTGAFLVFSVQSLGVARRAPQFALLGVLGLGGRARLHLVLAESLLLGLLGSGLGLALGTALAALALRWLGGDLGGGFFAGVAPSLRWSLPAALGYFALGVAAALAGGWWPARQAQALPPAQTLKGLGDDAASASGQHATGIASLGLMALGGLLAMLPPVGGVPLAAYVSVALLLLGGITALPWLIGLLYNGAARRAQAHLLSLLAVERARRVRNSAAVAVSAVVASLSLAVALTVMVASFRDSVTQWLDRVLPADLYVRTATSSAAGDNAYLTPAFAAQVQALPGVARVATVRTVPVLLDPSQPTVALIARSLHAAADGSSSPQEQAAAALPLQGTPVAVPADSIAIYVSEPVVELHGARVGQVFEPLARALPATARGDGEGGKPAPRFVVAGVWRDYSRQFGAIAIDRKDYERITGDRRVNDLALWLQPGADASAIQSSVRALAGGGSGQSASGELLEFASSAEIRSISLRVFDRSFAVTYWLQAVAIGIGLFGVAASFSAQVLARRKEFGLLAHLGFTRQQVLTVVAAEGAAWTLVGALAGLGLGLLVALVLVQVVNPQSFNWTMDLSVPWGRLLLLCAAVVASGTLTAWLAGRAAASRDAVMAVKEDW